MSRDLQIVLYSWHQRGLEMKSRAVVFLKGVYYYYMYE